MANLQNWMNQAKEHWKEFQPTKFKALQAAGTLDEALQSAADQTSKEMGDLRASGFNHQEAWEIVRESYLFPPQEGSNLQRNDSPMWSPSAPTTVADMMKAAASGALSMEIPKGMPRNAQEFKDALKDKLE